MRRRKNIASVPKKGILEDSEVFVLGGGGDCGGWVWVREASDQKRESWVRVEYLKALATQAEPWYFGGGRTAGEVIVASIGEAECNRAIVGSESEEPDGGPAA